MTHQSGLGGLADAGQAYPAETAERRHAALWVAGMVLRGHECRRLKSLPGQHRPADSPCVAPGHAGRAEQARELLDMLGLGGRR